MSELTDLTRRLREIADHARDIAAGLDRPIAPRLELRDYLQRELGVDATTWSARLQLDLVVEEITRIVVAPYADDTGALALELEELVDPDDELDRSAFDCLDCGASTLDLREYYMLREDVWAQVAEPDAGMLCIGCAEERLGRRLEPVDFMPIEMNLSGSERLLSRVHGREEEAA